jgi:uncharacterized protein DUF4154
MTGGMRKIVLAVVTAAFSFCPGLIPLSFAQNPAVESQVKAAFLYNFSKFIEWPARAFARPTEPFTFCLTGDPFGGELEKTIQGETLNGRPLTVRHLASGDSVTGCHVLYVGLAEGRRAAEMIGSASTSPMLSVGEGDDFIDNGGTIHFIQSGHRVRFEISPEAADRAGLRVSSRLLRLADIVHPKKRSGGR